VQVAGAVAPQYLEVARVGTSFSAYTSTDGATWTLIAGSTINLSGLSGSIMAGLAVTSHNNGALSTVTFSAVNVSTTTPPPPPNTCPTGWTCGDIGAATPTGTQALNGATWTIQGGGGDIWGTADSFHYVWQTLAADGSVSAEVTSQTNTSGWAKAGVMLRASNAANAPFYAVYITPGNGLAVQYRATAGSSAADAVKVAGSVAPLYLKVTRTGTTFSAFTSPDGVTWTLVAGSTESLPNLSGSLLAGMAVTSHNSVTLSTVVFKAVAIG
jgi:hypothetical protein